jgi:hypothetical protein
MRNYVLILVLLAASFLGGLFLGRSWGSAEPDVTEVRDTLTFHDTAFVDRPVPVYVSQIRTDTVRLALVDSSHTVVVRDSVEVEVPISRKVYEDSTYRAVISGYKANLDSLWVYHTIREINIVRTQKIPPKRWGFDVTLGPSVLVTPKGDLKGGMGITGGLSYRF